MNEIIKDHAPGDVCLYSYGDENKSRSIVEIVKILENERGIAEVKFIKVLNDDSGNGYFTYLQKIGGTMNASLKYLKRIAFSEDEIESIK